VVEVGLASVIYHEQSLRTTLFFHSGFVQTLRQHVKIESCGRTATGIPPHVCLLKQMNVLPGGVTQAVTTEVTAAVTTTIRVSVGEARSDQVVERQVCNAAERRDGSNHRTIRQGIAGRNWYKRTRSCYKEFLNCYNGQEAAW